jgi:hypothetical protein
MPGSDGHCPRGSFRGRGAPGLLYAHHDEEGELPVKKSAPEEAIPTDRFTLIGRSLQGVYVD